MQLTPKQAKALGLIEDEPRAAPRKKRGRGRADIPRTERAERTGLSTLILAGWSVRSPDSVRYQLYVINKPELDTGLCDSELAACNKAKELMKRAL